MSPKHSLSTGWAALTLLTLLMVTPSNAAGHGQWWPIQVKSYYGTYDAETKVPGQPSSSLGRARLEEWTPPAPPEKTYTLGVSFPHLKDTYWEAVNYGLIEEARRLGIGIRLVQAGGYDELARQNEQVRQLLKDGVDGLILGAISYEGNNTVIAEAVASGVPVVGITNDIHAPTVTAKAMVSYREMGYLAGEFVAQQAESLGMTAVSIAFFPGPERSGWAPESLEGFREAMTFFPGSTHIKSVTWGDTDHTIQYDLMRETLKSIGPVDFIVGNGVAADEATRVIKDLGLSENTKVVSTYMIPSLFDKILSGQALSAPSDLPPFQGRMAVDMIIRILEGETAGRDFPFRSGPFIPMITPDNIDHYPYKGLFGPRDYEPVLTVEP